MENDHPEDDKLSVEKRVINTVFAGEMFYQLHLIQSTMVSLGFIPLSDGPLVFRPAANETETKR